MTEQRLSRHGRNHGVLGSDPIPFDFQFLTEIVLASDTQAIDFSNIPQFGRHLLFRGEVRGVNDVNMRVRLNDDTDSPDTGLYYDNEELIEYPNGTSINVQSPAGNTEFGARTLYIANDPDITTDEPDAFSHFEARFDYYAGPRYKTMLLECRGMTQATDEPFIDFTTSRINGFRRATDPITRVRFFDAGLLDDPSNQMKAGSRISMYIER